jgi:hypothetical protein
MQTSPLRERRTEWRMAQLGKHSGSDESTATTPTMEPFVHEEDVRHYLDLYAHAVTTGDAKAIARMWDFPALVMGDQGARTVSSADELERLFAGVKDQYSARGIIDTRPDIERVEWLTEHIVSADVRWPLFDSDGHERGAEASTYLLMRDSSGALKLRVAVARGQSDAEAH